MNLVACQLSLEVSDPRSCEIVSQRGIRWWALNRTAYGLGDGITLSIYFSGATLLTLVASFMGKQSSSLHEPRPSSSRCWRTSWLCPWIRMPTRIVFNSVIQEISRCRIPIQSTSHWNHFSLLFSNSFFSERGLRPSFQSKVSWTLSLVQYIIMELKPYHVQ